MSSKGDRCSSRALNLSDDTEVSEVQPFNQLLPTLVSAPKPSNDTEVSDVHSANQ
jgi:hypothetical protein